MDVLGSHYSVTIPGGLNYLLSPQGTLSTVWTGQQTLMKTGVEEGRGRAREVDRSMNNTYMKLN